MPTSPVTFPHGTVHQWRLSGSAQMGGSSLCQESLNKGLRSSMGSRGQRRRQREWLGVEDYWVLCQRENGVSKVFFFSLHPHDPTRRPRQRFLQRTSSAGPRMKVPGLEIQICKRARPVRRPWVLDTAPLRRLSCTSYAPRLVWEGSFHLWCPPGKAL